MSTYALPQLTNGATSVPPVGRAGEWRDNVNTQNPIVSDRVVRGAGAFDPAWPDTHLSIWSADAGQAGDWNGGVLYNDGHTEYSATSRIEGAGARGVSAVNPDNLFHRNDLDFSRFLPLQSAGLRQPQPCFKTAGLQRGHDCPRPQPKEIAGEKLLNQTLLQNPTTPTPPKFLRRGFFGLPLYTSTVFSTSLPLRLRNTVTT